MGRASLTSADHPDHLFEFDGDAVEVGSGAVSEIVIENPTVSRRHAIFRRVEDSWLIEDLGSTNGTWVNGRLIIRPTIISRGDLIFFGGARFFFQDGKVPSER